MEYMDISDRTAADVRHILRENPHIAIAFALACVERSAGYPNSLARAVVKYTEHAKNSQATNDTQKVVEHVINAASYAKQAPIYAFMRSNGENNNNDSAKRKQLLKIADDEIAWQINKLNDLLEIFR